ncbi:MAG TPA: MgtC/SapB family protein [Terriglobia bacterium]|nr:MgtC/SapB family protein [Terriglobia bacterium]
MDPSIPLKLLLAAVLGGIIGIERQIRDKPAGLRTNILICVGSTLFMSISAKVAQVFGGDPTRIAAQIISGIGFLGAGAVLHSHGFVMGLTTAATIWVVAGVGMALGSGMYLVALFATAMSLVTLYFLSFVEDKIQGRRSYSYALVVSNLNQALASIHRVLQENSVSAASFNFKKEAGHYQVWFNLLISRETNIKIIQRLSEVPEIIQVETGSSPHELAAAVSGEPGRGEPLG